MADSAGARRREVENREALWLKVFGNGLILRHIEKYLGYTDLKLCREVSRSFNGLILEETDFKRRTVVNIKRETIEENVLEGWDWKMKTARVVPAMPDRYVMRKDKWNRYLSKDMWMKRKMKTVYSKIADVESLMFLQEACEDVENCRRLVPKIYETLTATEMLIELRISNDFIQAIAEEEDGDGNAEVREKVQARISTIQALDIDITNYGLAVVPSDSFQQLRKLRRLKIVPVISEQLMEANFVENSDVRGLMELNQGELEALVMKNTSSTLLDGLMFPKLKRIHIGVFAPHTASMIKFIEIHKNQLEDLYLRTHGSTQHRLLDVLNTLKELNPQLRALGIRVRKEWFWAGLLDLDRFVQLEEFCLELTVGFRNRNDGPVSVEYTSDLFKRLPSTLKKIRILRPWEQEELALPIAEIQSLRNVTSLYMESFNHSLTDDVLHAVFCNMVQLKELRIWRAAGITDAGFRGVVEVDGNLIVNPSFSLGNLKGLTHLEIRCCDLSDATVLDTIKFLGLRYLDIRNNKRTTAASFYAVLEQNPSLEGFHIDRVVSLPSLKRVTTFVRNKYPRLKQCEAIFGPPLCRHDGYLRDLQIELRQMIIEGMMDILIQLGMQEESNVPRMFRAILQLYEF